MSSAKSIYDLLATIISLTREDKAQLIAALPTYSDVQKDRLFAALRELHTREQAQLATLPPEQLQALLEKVAHIQREALVAAEHASVTVEQDQLAMILAAVERA